MSTVPLLRDTLSEHCRGSLQFLPSSIFLEISLCACVFSSRFGLGFPFLAHTEVLGSLVWEEQTSNSDFRVDTSLLVLVWGFFSPMSWTLCPLPQGGRGSPSCLDPRPRPVLHAVWSHAALWIHLLCSQPSGASLSSLPRTTTSEIRGTAVRSHQGGTGVASFVNTPTGTVQRRGCKGDS